MIDSITERTTILTPHARLSRLLILQYANRQKNLGKTIWTTPNILPLQAWLQKLWVQSWPRHFILSSLQSRKLWEKIIKSDKNLPNLNLLHLKGTASQASAAFALLKEYGITTEPDSFKGTTEFEAFHRWMCEYEQVLAEWRALDPAQISDFVRVAILGNIIPLPEHLIFAGFDEITPQLNCLLKLFNDKSIPVKIWPERTPIELSLSTADRCLEIRQYANPTEEAIQCARWIRHIFDSRSESSSADKTVGIVVPDITEYRDILQKELTAELTPKSIFPWETAEPRFNISTGTPLALEPLVNIALSLISIQSEAVPFSIFSNILKTPFLPCAETELLERQSLEHKLRSKNSVLVQLELLKDKLDSTPRLISLINSLQNYRQGKKRPSAWAHNISRLLKQNGWPGGEILSTHQNQAFESWKRCLDDLASLDNIVGEISRSQAVDILVQLTHDHQFNVNIGEHPIQVVSLAEAYGMQFDHLWIIGCHAETLPAPPSANPFIPPHLQKKHKLPHSSAHRELQYSENVLGQLITLSSNTVISFPEQNYKSELRISPLFNGYSNLKKSSINNVTHRSRDQLLSYCSLESWEDAIILPISKGELYSQHDGYQILKNQSDCPFRAFAKHRLHAKEFKTPEIDYDSAERGSLVHKVLHNFWSEVKTRDNLLELISNKQLEPRLKESIHKAIDTFHLQLHDQNQFKELEYRRLELLLLEWLEKESLRPEFTVAEMEKSAQIRLGGLDIKVRIDRIDKVANGKTFLIDYKTGKFSQRNLFEDRLQEIQLPLYAIQIKPDAVGFAEVSKGSAGNGFRYLARDNTVMPGFKPIDYDDLCKDWDSLLDRWKSQLTDLAEEFIAGKIEVNPYNAPATCDYCGLQTLCRIDERKPNLEPAEES